MKAVQIKVFAAAALMCCAAYANAQAVTTGATGTGVGNATGGNLNFDPTYGGSVTRYAASTAVAPQLVAGPDTCMGSSSVGGSATTFSFAFGTTWKDVDCRRIKNGREMWNMGMRAAALAELCTDDVMRYAIAVTGGLPYTRDDGVLVHRPCPMTEKEWHKAGDPLLDPISGTPMTAAELDPPPRPAPVLSLDQLPADKRAALLDQAKAALVEQHAAAIKTLTATNVVSK
jgi:hypothetical protein